MMTKLFYPYQNSVFNDIFRAHGWQHTMNHQSPEVQRLLGEKEQLKKEEEVLRSMIDKVKKQINALQVEHLQISTKVPATRLSPVETIPANKQETQPSNAGQENAIPEINLDILGSINSGSLLVNQGEVEEEEEDE